MSKPFDVATKQLIEADPVAWLKYAGLPGTAVQWIETNLTAVTVDADKILRVEADPPYLGHIEMQAGYETDLDERVLQYNVLAFRRHGLPVQSVVILLRPEADGPQVTGTAGYRLAEAELIFRYRIVRVWEKPVEEVLAGGLAILPLAPLAKISPEQLPEIVRRMEERIDREAPSGEAGILWTATYLLMGLRYQRPLIHQLLKGVRGMKESTTYQAILEEGEAKGETRWRVEEARNLLTRLGTKRFGPIDATTQAAIEAITSLERLEQLAERLLEAENWNELLA